jgi:mono/diheme cytochrome c family protein
MLVGGAGAALVAAVLARPLRAQEQEQEPARASEVEYEGWRQYMVHCARCHGDDAVAGVMAPDLRGSLARGAVPEAAFDSITAAGRSGKGMPGFQEQLRPDQIAAIRSYVVARKEARLPAGRPKR